MLVFGNSDEISRGGGVLLFKASSEDEEVETCSEGEGEGEGEGGELDAGKGSGAADRPGSWMMNLRMWS